MVHIGTKNLICNSKKHIEVLNSDIVLRKDNEMVKTTITAI